MDTSMRTIIIMLGIACIMAAIIGSTILNNKTHTPSPVPPSDLSKLVLICEKSKPNRDGYSFFRVYKFEDNNNTHYIVMNTSGGIAIK